MIPPKLERPAGRPRKKRIKASGEAGKRGPYQCKRCFQFGHMEKGCNATQAELDQELSPPRPKKQRKSKSATVDAEPSQNVADPKVMSSLFLQPAQVLQQGGWHLSRLEELIEGSLLAIYVGCPLFCVWAWLCKCGAFRAQYVTILPLCNTRLWC